MPIYRSRDAYFATATVTDTVLTLVTFGFTQAQVDAADRAFFSLEGGSLRLTWDTAKTTPTTTKGILVKLSDWPLWELIGQINLGRLQFCRDGSTNATVTIMLESD